MRQSATRLSLPRWLLQTSSKRPEPKFKHCNCRPVGIAPQGGFFALGSLRPSAGGGDRNEKKPGIVAKRKEQKYKCKFFVQKLLTFQIKTSII